MKSILKIMVCLVLLFAASGVWAQKPVVAVTPFDIISGVTEEEANMISEVFFVRLANSRKVILVDRSLVEKVVEEHKIRVYRVVNN